MPDSGTGARINSFDQWDVAPGEVAAGQLVPELQSDEAPYDAGSSTNAHPPAPEGSRPLGASAAATW